LEEKFCLALQKRQLEDSPYSGTPCTGVAKQCRLQVFFIDFTHETLGKIDPIVTTQPSLILSNADTKTRNNIVHLERMLPVVCMNIIVLIYP
jgi:hypothetical protein